MKDPVIRLRNFIQQAATSDKKRDGGRIFDGYSDVLSPDYFPKELITHLQSFQKKLAADSRPLEVTLNEWVKRFYQLTRNWVNQALQDEKTRKAVNRFLSVEGRPVSDFISGMHLFLGAHLINQTSGFYRTFSTQTLAKITQNIDAKFYSTPLENRSLEKILESPFTEKNQEKVDAIIASEVERFLVPFAVTITSNNQLSAQDYQEIKRKFSPDVFNELLAQLASEVSTDTLDTFFRQPAWRPVVINTINFLAATGELNNPQFKGLFDWLTPARNSLLSNEIIASPKFASFLPHYSRAEDSPLASAIVSSVAEFKQKVAASSSGIKKYFPSLINVQTVQQTAETQRKEKIVAETKQKIEAIVKEFTEKSASQPETKEAKTIDEITANYKARLPQYEKQLYEEACAKIDFALILARFSENIKTADSVEQAQEIAAKSKAALFEKVGFSGINQNALKTAFLQINQLTEEKISSLEPTNVITAYLKSHPHLVAVIKYATLSAAGLVALKFILPVAVVAAIGKVGLVGVRIALGTHLGQAIAAATISAGTLAAGLFKVRKPPTSQELLVKVIESQPSLLSELKLPAESTFPKQLADAKSTVDKMKLVHAEITNPKSTIADSLVAALNERYGIKGTLPTWREALQERLYKPQSTPAPRAS